MKELLRLFKAIEIEEKNRKRKPDKEILKKTIPYGFIFSPDISVTEEIIATVISELGLSNEQMNNSFHKSWKKVREANIEQLVMEQLIHYLTTYGFENLGIYNEESVYIPSEKLDLPEIDTRKIPLIVIKGLTKEEIKEKILKLLKSGIALHENTMKDVMGIIQNIKLTSDEIESVKNKEIKIRLYDELNLVPENAVEFLRFSIYKATGKTLLIKNYSTIETIKENSKEINSSLFTYSKEYGIKKLSEIFYRYKPLFLAMKNGRTKTLINKIRRYAVKYHKPMPESYLDTITDKLKNGYIDEDKLRKELEKVNTFRKIRLAYALKFRINTDIDSIMYKIRNGKAYSTDFKNTFNQHHLKPVLNIVMNSIIEDLDVKDKKIYIPEYVSYTLPATEKQFTGDIPSGSYIDIAKDMIFGIHWINTNRRIDLDLSTIDVSGEKIGWDSYYRNEGKTILFSGDMTDAPKPKGASELFYVKRQVEKELAVYVNYYNYDPNDGVPFKIIVGQRELKSIGMNYMVNPNDVKVIANTSINKPSKILGFVSVTTKRCRFYFSECYLGNSNILFNSEYQEKALKYLSAYYKESITLNEILEKAGAELVEDKENCDIDLSIESLTKDRIIELISK